MSQPQHLCFFSARCPFSQAFLEQLSQTPYKKEFRFICVDIQPGRPRPQLPAYLTAVPTLMIVGEKEPRTEAAVMNWLSERRLNDKSLAGGGGVASSVDSLAPMYGEMSGIGDEGFAYISEADFSPTKSQNTRLTAGMVSYNDPQLMGGQPTSGGPASMGAAGGGRGSNGMSAKAREMDDAMARLQAQRAADFAPIQRR